MKKLKNLFPTLFLAKTGWDRRRKREKNFTPEFHSYSTQAKIPKKMTKKFYSRMPFILDPAKKIPKEIVKKFKKFKTHFPTLFIAKTGWDRPRKRKQKFYFRIPFKLDSGKKIPKKITKKLKKLKNLFLTLFFAKTVWDRPRKRKIHFTPKFRSYSTQARKFWKK